LEGETTKSPAADTSRENALTAEFPAVHSPAGDKRWAVREAAARIDFLWVLSDMKHAHFPPDINQGEQQGRIQDEDSWGRWSSARPSIEFGPHQAPADTPTGSTAPAESAAAGAGLYDGLPPPQN
jgi:hypothetical protein